MSAHRIYSVKKEDQYLSKPYTYMWIFNGAMEIKFWKAALFVLNSLKDIALQQRE